MYAIKDTMMYATITIEDSCGVVTKTYKNAYYVDDYAALKDLVDAAAEAAGLKTSVVAPLSIDDDLGHAVDAALDDYVPVVHAIPEGDNIVTNRFPIGSRVKFVAVGQPTGKVGTVIRHRFGGDNLVAFDDFTGGHNGDGGFDTYPNNLWWCWDWELAKA